LLSDWLATVTVDEEAYEKAKLDKALAKAIDKNYGIFDSFEEAKEFYSQRLEEFPKNSLPHMRKCKNFAFLVA
jgi:hypothetical protein